MEDRIEGFLYTLEVNTPSFLVNRPNREDRLVFQFHKTDDVKFHKDINVINIQPHEVRF